MELADLFGHGLSTVLGGAVGFVGRMIPQAFKYFDDKADRAHELEMTKLQLQIDQARASQQIDLAHAQAAIAESQGQMTALVEAIKSQGQLTGNKWIDGLSQSVRPFVTYWWMALLTSHKVAEIYLTKQLSWSADDSATLSAILAFWFADRSFTKMGK